MKQIYWPLETRFRNGASSSCYPGYLTLNSDEDSIRFSYIKERKLHQKRVVLKSRASLQEAFHSREVSCVLNFKWPSVHAANHVEVLVTSGEDTDIKMWEGGGDTSTPSGQLRHLKTLTGHISSVKALKSIGRPLESGVVTDTFLELAELAQKLADLGKAI